MLNKEVKEIVDWMYSKDNPNHEYNRKNNPSKAATLKSFIKQNRARIVQDIKNYFKHKNASKL